MDNFTQFQSNSFPSHDPMQSTPLIGLYRGITLGALIAGLIINCLSLYGFIKSRSSRSPSDFLLNANICITSISFCSLTIIVDLIELVDPLILQKSNTLCKIQVFYAVAGLTNYGIIQFFTAASFLYSMYSTRVLSRRNVCMSIIFSCSVSTIYAMGASNILNLNTLKQVVQPSGIYCYVDFSDHSRDSIVYNGCTLTFLLIFPLVVFAFYLLVWQRLQSMLDSLSPGLYSDAAKKMARNVLIRGTLLALLTFMLFAPYMLTSVYQLLTGTKIGALVDGLVISMIHLVPINFGVIYIILDIRCSKVVSKLFSRYSLFSSFSLEKNVSKTSVNPTDRQAQDAMKSRSVASSSRSSSDAGNPIF